MTHDAATAEAASARAPRAVRGDGRDGDARGVRRPGGGDGPADRRTRLRRAGVLRARQRRPGGELPGGARGGRRPGPTVAGRCRCCGRGSRRSRRPSCWSVWPGRCPSWSSAGWSAASREALIDVSLMVLVARVLPAALRPRMFSLVSAAWILPSVLGPVVTGVVTEQLGWRWVFLGVLRAGRARPGCCCARRSARPRGPADGTAAGRAGLGPARRSRGARAVPGRRAPVLGACRGPCSCCPRWCCSSASCGCCRPGRCAGPAGCRRWSRCAA